MRYSVVVPAHNEEESIRPLYQAVRGVMEGLDGQWELLFINDGSQDKTGEIIEGIVEQDNHVKLISFRRQFGQTAAWSAGFDYASGDYVVVLDADLQNDPKDIPAMITKLKADDLDVISGWRKNRQDNGLLMIGSRLGNIIHRWMTAEKIHDHGCSLKVYRAEALEELELYGEMHRYITALLAWKGFKVGEIVVAHHPRKYGQTNYSIRKKLKGLLDLIVVKFWIQYSARPMHFFGTIGASFIGAGLLLGGTLAGLWLFRVIGLANRSTPLLAVLLVLLGFQFLLTGVLADVVAKTYYSQKKAYSIKRTKGFDKRSQATVGLGVSHVQYRERSAKVRSL